MKRSLKILKPKEQREEKMLQSESNQLSLRELMSVGISRAKAERALSAVGYRSSMHAFSWLLRHNNDPLLSEDYISREFMLCFCASGKLAAQFQNFANQVEEITELSPKNVIATLPHVKMCTFFQCPDSKVIFLHTAMDMTFRQYKDKLASWSFKPELTVLTRSLVVFLNQSLEKCLTEFAAHFAKNVASLAQCIVVPYPRQLHLTLLHDANTETVKTSEDIFQCLVDLSEPSEWDIRLYSRDSRASGRETFVVREPYRARREKELSLNIDDHIFAENTIDSDGYLFGCSYLTGETGKFPSSNVTRGKESDTWSLHKSYAVILPTNNNVTDNTLSLMTDRDHILLESMYKSPNFQRTKNLSPYLPPDYLRPQRGEPQKLFCVRHGERVDSVFGSNWAEQAFDRNGCYQRTNLNMPSTLPRRRNPWKDFFGDSPLTEIGMMQARLTGEALRQRGIVIHYCYSSPAFRCIQTAHNILLGMGIEKFIKIHIEPGIFEFLGWYDRGIPTFLTPEELVDCNFNIDLSYKPTIPLERLSADEKYLDYYNRSYKTTQNITERHKMEGGNILLSGHAASLEVCTRQICGFPPRSYQEFNHVIRKVSFLGLSFCEREKDGSWRLREPPIPHIQHTNNPLFDWKVIR